MRRPGLRLLCKESLLKTLTGNPFWFNIQTLNFTATLSDWKNSSWRQEAFFPFHFLGWSWDPSPAHCSSTQLQESTFLNFNRKSTFEFLNKYDWNTCTGLHLFRLYIHHYMNWGRSFSFVEDNIISCSILKENNELNNIYICITLYS